MVRTLTVLAFALLLAGCNTAYTGTKQPPQAAGGLLSLPDLGPAPELRGLGPWLNGPPQQMADLRGSVVLVNFWTFGCINCVRTLPYVAEWQRRYTEQGLVVIGVHAPEFDHERKIDNVESALRKHGITYAVALDPDFATWKAYNNRYWPAFYFIDRSGHVRHTHFGEGSYEHNEAVIGALLAEASL